MALGYLPVNSTLCIRRYAHLVYQLCFRVVCLHLFICRVCHSLCRGLRTTCPSTMLALGLSSDCQAWWQTPLLMELSHQPSVTGLLPPLIITWQTQKWYSFCHPVPWANQTFKVKWHAHAVLIFLTHLHDKHAALFIVFCHISARAVMKVCVVLEHGNLHER